MAEVATKKTINVVSNKKSEVCSVPSNNGLIDLESITTNNDQLITLCDNNDDEDDLILTNNTHNDLDSGDKSLQELIENELALRICSSSEEPAVLESEDQGDFAQPEPIKRIVLDQKEAARDINAEFIAAESEHCAVIEEPYTYQNGHASPAIKVTDTSCSENVQPEPTLIGFRDEEEQLLANQPEIAASIQRSETEEAEEALEAVEPESDDLSNAQISEPVDKPIDLMNTAIESINESIDDPKAEDTGHSTGHADKYAEEEEALNETEDDINTEFAHTNGKYVDTQTQDTNTWLEEDRYPDGHQFSDNFDETLGEGGQCAPSYAIEESTVDSIPKSTIKIQERFDSFANEEEDIEGVLDSSRIEDQSLERIDPESSVEASNAKSSTEEEMEEESAVAMESRGLNGMTASQSERSAEAASTQEFIDTERRVLSEESGDHNLPEDHVEQPASPEKLEEQPPSSVDEDELKEEANCSVGDDQNQIAESSSELSVSESTFIEKTEVIVSEHNVTILSVTKCVDELEHDDSAPRDLDSWTTVEEATRHAESSNTEEVLVTVDRPEEQVEAEVDEAEVPSVDQERRHKQSLPISAARAPLATPDETSDVSNSCDSESREETITSSTSVVTSSSVKGGTKTKKKKIEGVAGNDASPNLTPRTKKTKKSKKSDLEKENISVNSNLQDTSMHTGPRQSHPEMIDFANEDDLSNVNVKSLTQNYVSEATRNEQERSCKERIATGVSIKQLCRSFGDISNMSDGDQPGFGRANHTMENEEKARSMGDLRVCERGYSKFTKDALVFTGVSVKALRASYCSLANLTSEGKDKERPRFEKSSFNKFDALSKKTVLHVRSVDAGKVQQQLNSVGQNGDANQNCRSCGKVVFQMEQTKAEGLVWHKNCFRCVQCSKQLNVDNYESHESTLYCKPHFKELFQPKPVEESDQPASDKPDLGLEELSSLNVKSRFQVFEKAGSDTTNEIERSPSQIAVKRSPSILSKLAKFQAKGMDIGVADESLNGIPYEESSESEEEEDPEENEEADTEIVKAKRATRERPMSFTKMDDIKSRWETTSQQGRREVQREARKEEIAGIRSRLFMGKQGKMKEMYQQAVAGSERVTKINAAEELQNSSAHARSIKERFERGETLTASDDDIDSGKPKPEKADEEVIAAGISRKSRSLFLELDASAAKTGRPVTPVNPKTPAEAPRRARDAFMGRQVSDDVVRSTDTTEEVQVETSDITNKFKFFESYKEPEKQRKQFRITPPRDGQVKMDSPEREIYRDPDVVRAEDRVNDVVHTDTARKMLSIFRQMEENATKKEVPNGPKPLKRFTPPPEDKFAKPTASETDEDEEEEGEESEGEDSAEERDPNYVRASDKVEDEFLKQSQNAARAKTLCAKFEHWEETDGKVSSNNHIAEMEMAQGEQSSIESARSLKARFESLGSQTNESLRTPKVKVNRFVEIQTTCIDVCESCEKRVYPLEKVETNNKIFHKQCFRCLQCNCILRMDTFTLNNGKLYCIPHFKQLFITRGNYDEGFGVDPHKNKWSSNASQPTSPSPIAVSNGDI